MGGPQVRVQGRDAQLVWRECYTIVKNAAAARAFNANLLVLSSPCGGGAPYPYPYGGADMICYRVERLKVYR